MARPPRPKRLFWSAGVGLSLATIACGGSDEGGSDDEGDGATVPSDPAWTSFGNGDANSRANPAEKTLSTSNVGQLEKKWSIEESVGTTLAGVTCTPAVVDGIVYYGTWRGVIRAVRANDGSVVWERTAGGNYGTSPLIEGDTIYWFKGSAEVAAIDRHSGEERWATKVHDHPNIFPLSSVALGGDVLVVGVASGEVFSPTPNPTFRGRVVGVDRMSGDHLWTVDVTNFDGQEYGAGISVWGSPGVDEERKLAFIGTGQSWKSPASPLSDALVAINYESGDVAWHFQFTENDVWYVLGGAGPDHDVGSTPNLFSTRDLDAVGIGDKAGNYYAIDRGDGTMLWETNLGRGGALGGVMSESAYHDGIIYVTSNTWDASGSSFGGGDFADAANKSHLFALEAATGSVKWEVVVDGPSVGGLAVANGVLYMGSTDGALHAFDVADGKELFTFGLTSLVGGGVSVSEGMVFVGQGFLNIARFGSNDPIAPAIHAFGLP